VTEPADVRSIEVMRQEIAMIPVVVADQISELGPRVRDLVGELRASPRGREVILTGCGDSRFAGIAARLAFERYGGVRCRAAEPLELVRYDVRYVPSDVPPLLVAISYSGEVGRTIEAAATGRRFGWEVIALTGRPDGRLARESDGVLALSVPTLGFSPGTSTYVATLVALYLLGAELARAAGRSDQASSIDVALEMAPDLIDRTIALSSPGAQESAERWATAPVTTFLGAGPSFASAAFGAAKLFEGPQRWGVVEDLEEWAHLEYFVSGPSTPLVVVAPSGASRDRAAELLAEMAFIGAPATLVSDVSSDDAASLAGRVLPVAPGLDEAFSPLLTCLPLALAASHLAHRLGARAYGFPDDEREREHYETIHRDTRGEPA
jgi:glucosamine--fructose-6-phosphate aminotransferase (isomerizing)